MRDYLLESQSKILKKRNQCVVTKKINAFFCALKECNKTIIKPKFVDRFNGVKEMCETSIEIKLKIETLSLVLFPEYTYAKIDSSSLNRFLDEEQNYVEVCFFDGRKITPSAYVVFEPKKEDGK